MKNTLKFITSLALIAVIWLLVPAVEIAADERFLAMEGRKLSADQAAALEAGLVEKPEDADSRIRLLGYYFMKRDDQSRQARLGHILWLIQHRPTSEVLCGPEGQLSPRPEAETYARVKSAWQDQIAQHENDAQVHGTAARFFTLHDRELAIELLTRAQALDSANPMWSQQLGHLYSLGMPGKSGEERAAAAARSLEQFEKAMAVADESERRVMLGQAAKTAFESGDGAKARSYALEMVSEVDESSWNYGNSIHHGNLLLGRLALMAGDAEMAKLHLTEAGKTPGSPQLNSFGPNMTLAKELLEKGESEAVLGYFELCGKFWEHDGGQLEAWTEEVRAGKVPSFGANLNY